MLLAAHGTDHGRPFDCEACSQGETGPWEATKEFRACNKVRVELAEGKNLIAAPRGPVPPPMEKHRLLFCGKEFDRCPAMQVGEFERRMLTMYADAKNLSALPEPGGLNDQSEVFLGAMRAIESGYNAAWRWMQEERSRERG